jgi:hypothetical protein
MGISRFLFTTSPHNNRSDPSATPKSSSASLNNTAPNREDNVRSMVQHRFKRMMEGHDSVRARFLGSSQTRGYPFSSR